MIKIPCHYANPSDRKIKELSELKDAYSTTQSTLIKSLLHQAEDLILFRVGSRTMIVNRIKSVVNPTLEEKCFFKKLKKMLPE